jgi:hypothetical protein
MILSADGERRSPDVFVVSGSYKRPLGASLELGVVRYAGDPADLDGKQFISVYDLVALGLIEPSDILLVKTDFSADGSYSVDVAVTGLTDEQIAVFVAGVGTATLVCVPATGPLAAGALALALMAATYRRLRSPV